MVIRRGGENKPACGNSEKKNFGTRELEAILISSILGMEAFGGYPLPPSLSNGIIGLEENLEVIYGAQRVAGKILGTKELRVLPLRLSLLLAPWR
jgi:hypothetical protein